MAKINSPDLSSPWLRVVLCLEGAPCYISLSTHVVLDNLLSPYYE